MIVTVPITVLSLGSFVAYRANPFFVHDRVGRHGTTFRFVKIRSLPASTPEYMPKGRLPRIQNNSWGRFIRAHHLDELPQVWHVVMGQMSLVGPRPEMPDLDALHDANFRARRLSVLPGCTGLWQISKAGAGMISDSPEFDTFYVENWSLRLDVWILLKTIKELMGGEPIESLDAIPSWVTRRRHPLNG